jgi:hypothetical protein
MGKHWAVKSPLTDTEREVITPLAEWYDTESRRMLSEREEQAKEVAKRSLPTHLRWLVRYPRLLGAYWHVRPAKKPTLTL